jgi:cysteinyl-tRNA synthetase
VPIPFFYQLQDSSVASLMATDFRAAVVDMDNVSADPADIDKIQAQGKLLFTYLSIGEAEDYRRYWIEGRWSQKKPAFVLGANPDWPDNFYVKFWEPAWQAIMFRRVDEAVALGYDGMYLDVVEAYQVPQVSKAYRGPGNVRQAMINFVLALSARAKARNPHFMVIPQNAVELLAASAANPTAPNEAYLAAIDGVGVEDLWFNDNKPSPWTKDDLAFLKLAVAADKFVLATSYPTQDSKQAAFVTKALDAGFVPFVGDRELTGAIDPVNRGVERAMVGRRIDTPWRVLPGR